MSRRHIIERPQVSPFQSTIFGVEYSLPLTFKQRKLRGNIKLRHHISPSQLNALEGQRLRSNLLELDRSYALSSCSILRGTLQASQLEDDSDDVNKN